MGSFLLAMDQGTTGSTALLLDDKGRTAGRANVEFPQHYPQPGWVEHDPEEIWKSVTTALYAALTTQDLGEIAAIGITNQRETTVVWDRATGNPIANAIVWQDRRTAEVCDRHKAAGVAPKVLTPSVLPLSSLTDLNCGRAISASGELSMKLATTRTGSPRTAERTTRPKSIE